MLPLPLPVFTLPAVNFDADPAGPDVKGEQKRAQVAVDISVTILACASPIVLAGGAPVAWLPVVDFPAMEMRDDWSGLFLDFKANICS